MDKQQLLEDDLKYIWRPFTQMKSLENDANKPIIIKKGKGIYLEDIDGNKYIDAVSSWWVNTLGHSNSRLNRVIYKQAKKIEHVIFGGFSHEPVIKFSKKLVELLNKDNAKNVAIVIHNIETQKTLSLAVEKEIQKHKLNSQTYYFNSNNLDFQDASDTESHAG
jgi:4-aminobutyrate aminotransferase-like enzyme